MEIFKVFAIEAAHRLPNVPEGHKCGRLHGHSYKIKVFVKGTPNPQSGWLMDFADLKAAFQLVFDTLDHRYMNEIEGLENPTSENLARWIWDRLNASLPCLSRIVVSETCTSGCVYRGSKQ